MNTLKNKAISLLTLLTMSVAGTSAAEWTVYPYFYPSVQKIADTGKIVYYVAGNSLFSYDPEAEESYSYTINNKLNDKEIKSIEYNNEKNYLFILYASGAADLLYDNGDVFYMPELRDADLASGWKVNSVDFNGDNIYVSTSFGIVKFNEPRKEVSSYGIYPYGIGGSTVMGDKLVVAVNGGLRYIDKDADLRSLDNYTVMFGTGTLNYLYGINDNTVVTSSGAKPNIMNYIQINFERNIPIATVRLNENATKLNYRYVDDEGNFLYITESGAYKLDKNLNHEKLFDLPADYATGLSALHNDKGEVWNVTGQGLMYYKTDSEGNVTVKLNRFSPEQLNTRNAMQLAYDVKNKKMWIGNITASVAKYNSSNKMEQLSGQTTSVYYPESDRFENVTPYPVDARMQPAINYQNTYGKYFLAPTMMAFDPDDTDTYYVTSGNEGVMKVKNKQPVGFFDSNNSPLLSYWGCNAFGVKIDNAGNLWIAGYGSGDTGIHILPASLRKADISTINKSDWHTIPGDLFGGGNDMSFLEYKNQYMLVCSHGGMGKILIYDNNKTPDNFSDDKVTVVSGYVDQDGKTNTPAYVTCFAEDNNGRIWFGTDAGVYIINDISNVSGGKINVTKVKVPRNDGTSEADYLLGSETTVDIAVDGANRKWIATNNSGLYQVNPNGSEILEVFGPSNSPLFSNHVNAVEVLPGTCDLFIGTNEGLYRYNYDTEGTTEKLDELLIYPNPVKPEYLGMVTIKGLMDNTLVKITDSAGNFVAQGRSENGEYRWNCQNINGKKVPTGVYYVIVSESSSGTSTSSIGKIMVIN